jgi:hypothetical protein
MIPDEKRELAAAAAAIMSDTRVNGPTTAIESEISPVRQSRQFPDKAWRGLFGHYRDVMARTTEASEVAHFASIWAMIAVSLGRRVWFYSGDRIYPNVYLSVVGPSGDKKTTAMRRAQQHDFLCAVPDLHILGAVGSTEGLTEKLQHEGEQQCLCLFIWEELSALLTRGRWQGSTLFEFLTEVFDCPPQWELVYRKNPIKILMPTINVIAGTTPEWFWKSARPEDFYGGFANRFLFLSGPKKAPMPNPIEPDPDELAKITAWFAKVLAIAGGAAEWMPQARDLWESFYVTWEGKERSGLVAAALKRVHVYVRKLALAYAACEGSFPKITESQLDSAIAVGKYAADCIEDLIDHRAQNAHPEQELEQKALAWVRTHDGSKKRLMQQSINYFVGSCEVFNRILLNLVRAGHIEQDKDGRIWLSHT